MQRKRRSTRSEASWARRLSAVAPLLLACAVACTERQQVGVAKGGAMAERDTRLVGMWTKANGGSCASRYPVHLRFEPTGLYFGTTEPPGEFTWWDGGTWKVAAPGKISLSIANDAVVDYRYSLGTDTFDVTDSSGCSFSYRRVR
jgi:hypothetical protein